jgi:alpha-D-ribose 1-methylphosphonate 5-triphosphate synthase subunit PhnH
MTTASIDFPGFADPVGDAQTTFRAVLDAMARPGRLCAAGAGLRPPAPLDRATAAVALTLVDQETTLYLDLEMLAAAKWLAFHAGSPIVPDHATADFILAAACPDEAPEDSATLILQVAALGVGTAYRLAGPGLAEPTILRATGMPDSFVAAWRRNHALFPRGVDTVICAGEILTALPRSVTMEIM